MSNLPDTMLLESPIASRPCRAWTIAVCCAAGLSLLRTQEGGVVAEFCKDGPACTEDTLEIVFESGTSTYDGPLEAGVEIPVEVVLDTKTAVIQGFSYAVKHDPEQLTLLPSSVTTAGTILDPGSPDTALGDPSFVVAHSVPGGFISAVVLALTEKREMPLGRHAICRAEYRVDHAPSCAVIRFVHRQLATPRSPSVAVNITANGLSMQPRLLRHGLVGRGACAETCDDIADNDADGLADCADPECANGALCGEEICDDGIDNDRNMWVDCHDRSCRSNSLCPPEECGDGADNDLDGTVDCEDPDCFTHEQCQIPSEQCSDGWDNDGDALVDCDDPVCWELRPECREPEVCNDSLDNDRDGGADCSDRDCAGDPACPGLEACGDGMDNDGDGLVDCSDRECTWEVPCIELCDDGVDNDGDGFVDRLDRGCTGHGYIPNQGAPVFPFYIRGDADGSGRINILDAAITIQVVLLGAAPAFDCPEALNTNADGGVGLSDALHLLQYIFLDGAPPPQPFPACGSHYSGGCFHSSPGCGGGQ